MGPTSLHSALGQGLVLAALFFAAFGAVTGFAAGYRRSREGLAWSRIAAFGFAAALVLANAVMLSALLAPDFTVSYVAQVGSRTLALHIAIASLWASLEGSILFWGGILAVYVLALSWVRRRRHEPTEAYALATLLAVSLFFALLLAGPSNPFRPVPTPPADGPGPNPLLQNHFLMAVHPPVLYLGYVGLAVPYAMAMAALLSGELSRAYLGSLRRWTLVAWAFLSAGIVLGAYWAYEVLGWGGYWAWDPVENASLLPWLTCTAFLHSAIVTQHQRTLKAWTVGLLLTSFLLTLLGTFMTRSGIFNSVHAFTQSDIGPLFLALLALLMLFSLVVLAGRSHLFTAQGSLGALVSRQSSFLLGNVLLAVLTFTVLLGTVFPLVTEVLRGTKVSVGEPYFNSMAVPICLPILLLMGLGPLLPWGAAHRRRLGRNLAWPVVGAVVTPVLCLAAGWRGAGALATFSLSCFAGVVTLRELVRPFSVLGARLPPLDLLLRHRRRTGAYLVHLAIVCMAVGIAASKSYQQSSEASLLPGGSMRVGDLSLTFLGLEQHREQNRTWVAAQVIAQRDGTTVGELRPRINYYDTSRDPIATPSIRRSGLHDLYVSLMATHPDSGQVTLKAFVNPLVALIWWGLPLLLFGVALAVWPRASRVGSYGGEAKRS